MINIYVLPVLLGGTLMAMTACSSSGSSRGNVPDEFNVVKKAPLTVPPEYSLRPPEIGDVRPIEVDPTRQSAQVFAFGTDIGQNASRVEQVLVARAGAVAVSPIIRDVIDYDESGLLRKGRTITNAVTSYQGNEEELAAAAADNATGGGEVSIQRGSGRRIKLPGT